jgi:hypothetical protein
METNAAQKLRDEKHAQQASANMVTRYLVHSEAILARSEIIHAAGLLLELRGSSSKRKTAPDQSIGETTVRGGC